MARPRRELSQDEIIRIATVARRHTDGAVVETELIKRMIAISSQQLKAVPYVLAVAGGSYKHDATSAALRSGHIHSIVTDSGSARALLRS